MTKETLISIVMGSQSDWETMQNAASILDEFSIGYEAKIVSAHRTPDRLFEYSKSAHQNGIKVIIAGAGGAAHLPGMIASLTHIPVLGVPIETHALKGMDSLLSIVQMPGGVPVATFAIGKSGAVNAALFAISILASTDDNLADLMIEWRKHQTDSIGLDPRNPIYRSII